MLIICFCLANIVFILCQLYFIIKSMEVSTKKYALLTTPCLQNVRSAEHLQSDTGKSFLNPLTSKNFQKYEVIVQNQQLQNELKLIQWRSKTELPIVKILFYKILQKKLLNQCSVLQLAIQNFPCNLNSLPKMPFYQLLYLLKESLIGFQRLFDKFGPFDISNKMILIGKNSRCRVWINQNITLNFPSKRTKLTESQFLCNASNIFEDKCLKSALSTQLFATLKKHSRILEAIQYIQNFVKNYRIVLPNKLNPITQSLGSKKLLEKYQENIEKINGQHFGHDTLRKVPKFIAQLREDKRLEKEKDNKSADSLMKQDNKSADSPTKMPNNKKLNRDLSQKNVKNPTDSPVKKQEVSIDNSNISPKSQISDLKKETKSFISKKTAVNGKNVESLNTLLLQKGKSQQRLKPCFMLSPTKQHVIASEKTMKTQGLQEFGDELFYTKLPNKPSQKPRKHSDQDHQTFIQKADLYQLKLTFKEKCLNSVQSSQQTAATNDQHYKKAAFESPKNQADFNRTPFCNLEIKEEEESKHIFQRNGWLKRINSLGTQNIRETIKSQQDGNDIFGEQYAFANENLVFLGLMGKELKGSIIEQQ